MKHKLSIPTTTEDALERKNVEMKRVLEGNIKNNIVKNINKEIPVALGGLNYKNTSTRDNVYFNPYLYEANVLRDLRGLQGKNQVLTLDKEKYNLDTQEGKDNLSQMLTDAQKTFGLDKYENVKGWVPQEKKRGGLQKAKKGAVMKLKNYDVGNLHLHKARFEQGPDGWHTTKARFDPNSLPTLPTDTVQPTDYANYKTIEDVRAELDRHKWNWEETEKFLRGLSQYNFNPNGEPSDFWRQIASLYDEKYPEFNSWNPYIKTGNQDITMNNGQTLQEALPEKGGGGVYVKLGNKNEYRLKRSRDDQEKLWLAGVDSILPGLSNFANNLDNRRREPWFNKNYYSPDVTTRGRETSVNPSLSITGNQEEPTPTLWSRYGGQYRKGGIYNLSEEEVEELKNGGYVLEEVKDGK